MNTWYAYIAGFFDGEGSICISRAKMAKWGFQDNHRLGIDIAQHIDRISVLYDIEREFGGRVAVKKQNARSFTPGAPIANWHLQKRADVRRFLSAILPYLRLKTTQAELALAFLDEAATSEAIRVSGRFGGRNPLTEAQMECREQFRLQMREANRLSTRPVKDVAV